MSAFTLIQHVYKTHSGELSSSPECLIDVDQEAVKPREQLVEDRIGKPFAFSLSKMQTRKEDFGYLLKAFQMSLILS